MSLSAERIAIADRAIQQTFARSSVAWQAVPNWDTGDRGQVQVRGDVIYRLPDQKDAELGEEPFSMTPLELDVCTVPFKVTLAQATAPTPDAVLAAVIPRAVQLARKFDDKVLDAAFGQAVSKNREPWYRALAAPMEDALKAALQQQQQQQQQQQDPTSTDVVGAILKRLIEGRQVLEDNGYRGQSCLIASTAHFTDLSRWVGSNVATEGLLVGANANSLHRASRLDKVDDAGKNQTSLMMMLGRAQEIPHGAAGSASPGEEPVDLAVSVPPSLEVIGENATGQVELAVRMRFATRVKDARGVVVFHT
jgi:hypothetical protein